MGCDSRLYFPPETRVRDVAQVLAILLGAEPSKGMFSNGEGWTTDTDEELRTETTSVPEMLVITGTVRGKQVYNHWHWEADSGPAGYRLMTCGMFPDRFPALEALADFFGGILDFNDCDAVEVDFMGDIRRKGYRLDANDGDGWYAFEGAKLALADDPARPYAWPS